MTNNRTNQFGYDERSFLLDGRPITIRSGELHYFRVPRPYWRDRLEKALALGLNTVCTYMPWNLHEPAPGVFDFNDRLDVRSFVQLAQELGLWVILRPGPYICAEWDFGGLPAWLLRGEVGLRRNDARFTGPVRSYLGEVGRRLSDLTVPRGGPILMVQVENEYGNFSDDHSYMKAVEEMVWQSGFDDVPLFTSDDSSPERLRAGTLASCLATVNFGSKPQLHLERLRMLRPAGPAMCGEYWCGWFDAWGRPRNGTDTTESAGDVAWMLDHGMSFNLYMFHGGTNFGFTSGANFFDFFTPDVTSYDYRAPLDEAGRPTAKYWAIRKAIEQRLPAGETLPRLPEPVAVVSVPGIRMTSRARLWDAMVRVDEPVQPQSMERNGLDYGYVVYRCDIEGLGGGTLRADVRDVASVWLDGAYLGTLSRLTQAVTLGVPPTGKRLDIVVAALGRVNFGHQSIDPKGIVDRIELGIFSLSRVQCYAVPTQAEAVHSLVFNDGSSADGPGYYRGTFDMPVVGDTFLDMRGFKMGCVWVNGHNLGRYWSIGPQQTLYCPGCWLEAKGNEIVVLEILAVSAGVICGLPEPILGELRDSPVDPTTK